MKGATECLYENIMHNISTKLKDILNENINKFDTVDYSEDDIIDQPTMVEIGYKYHPKDREQLIDLVDQRISENPQKPYLLDIDTSQIISMSAVFSSCESIEELDLSTWNTSNVASMSWMFGNCKSLKKIDLSSFDTSNVIYMNCMFYNCKNLSEIDLSNFNTSKVSNMHSMFNKCELLKTLDLSNFDTSSLTHIGAIFSYCYSLEELDLSNWDISNIDKAYMSNIFSNCNSLKTLYTNDKELTKRFNMRKKVTESIQKFNVEDYQESDNDIIDQTQVTSIIKPKSLDEESKFFNAIKPSDASLTYAEIFKDNIKRRLKPLMNIKLTEKCLRYNDNSFFLYGAFSLKSSIEEDNYVEAAYVYSIIDFNYDIAKNKFTFYMNVKMMAKMIEFCSVYGNMLMFHFTGQDDYFAKFQNTLSQKQFLRKDTSYTAQRILPNYNNLKKIDKPMDQVEALINWIYIICEQFAEFVPNYLKTYNSLF